MARFTSIGMGRKTFVASAAEDRQTGETTADSKRTEQAEAGPSNPKPKSKARRGKKRTRDGAAKDKSTVEGFGAEKTLVEQLDKPAGGASKTQGWTRDRDVAKRAKLNAQLSAERRIKRQNLNTSNTTCFACRSIGHAARDCPNVLLAAQGLSNDGTAAMLGGEGEQGDKTDAAPERKGMKRGKGKSGGEVTGGKCYRCDSTSHSLSHCPVKVDPSNPTPFATCFICLANGHLSSLCPNNTKGIYVKGGSCKVCGSVKHRASDCPDDKRGKRPEFDEARNEGVPSVGPMDVGADEDDFMVQARLDISSKGKEGKGKKRKHPPNNNGPREKYSKFKEDGAGANPVLADSTVVPDERPLPTSEPVAAQKPVTAPTSIAKKAKPKVVKF